MFLRELYSDDEKCFLDLFQLTDITAVWFIESYVANKLLGNQIAIALKLFEIVPGIRISS